MLTHLRIARLGVIDEASVDLGPGFTVVTGETGAGKTMVVSSLGLLLGDRGEARLIRHGADRALVEGRLALDESLTAAVEALGGEVEDDEVLLARHVTATRSRALVGGAQVPANALGGLAAERITVHGQSEQVRLGSPERQREVLDAFAGPELAGVLAEYRRDHTQHRALQAERSALLAQASDRARELAMLEFGLGELERAKPLAGEDVALRGEAQRLQAVDDLRAGARRALVALAGDDEGNGDDPTALGLVGSARKALAALADRDAEASGLAERVSDVGYALNDVVGALASYLASLDADPARLEWIAGRLSELQGLTRRYGASVDDVIEWGHQAAARASELSGSDDRIAELTAQLDALDARLTVGATRLTELRRAAATDLAGLVRSELTALAMPHAQLAFQVIPAGRGPHGADAVALMFSANPGSSLAPLSKVASGGELSRVRLALEVVLAASSTGHTFVFDEVDAGIGGAVALEIGRRLSRLAKTSQVIAVTHLAQVAAFADRHFVVSKADDGQVTTSGVSEVTGEERVREIARMMAGLESSTASREHAVELLQTARDR